jgi:ABC-type bacteriocin/lantibiotic exporter with double-glycine peptidase domain
MIRDMVKILKITDGGPRFALLVLLRSPISIAMTLVNAVFLRRAFDAVTLNSADLLIAACIFFGAASLATFLYNGTVWSVYAAPTTIEMECKMRIALFDKISSLPFWRVEALPKGEWLTRLNADVQAPFSESWPHTFIAVVNICASSFILCRMNPAVYGLIILFVVPHIIFSQLVIARVMPLLKRKSLEAAAINTDDLDTLITCAGVAALYDGKDYFMARFEKSSMALFRANMRIRARNALSAGVLPLFGLGGYLVLLIVCGGWIADGRFTFGGLTAAFQLRGGVLLGSLALIDCMVAIQANMAGVRRLNEIMDLDTKTEVA